MAADNGQPFVVFDDSVELVAVRYEKSFPINGLMGVVQHDFNSSEIMSDVFAKHLVMVAGDVNDFGPFAGHLEKTLDDVVILVGPEPAFLEHPDVEEVPYYVELLAFDCLEEDKEFIGVAIFTAKMDIRDKDGLIFFFHALIL